jgi:hypothetical protein
MVRKRLTPDGRLEKQTLRCEHRDLILTRSAYDHKRMRPLKPMVGVVKSLGYYRRRPVGLIRTQKFQLFLKQKAHFGGRKLQDDLSAQG